MSEFLALTEVLALHADQIRRYGGAPGIRDPGLLASALYRPQCGYYHDLIAEAAALWESLSQNHPFVDGNKRVAFIATRTFLAINGLTLTASDRAAQQFLLPLYASGQVHFATLEAWLRRNTIPR